MTTLADVTAEERAYARENLRDPEYKWESATDARDFYARFVADEVIRHGWVHGDVLYAYALAARLVRYQQRRVSR